MTGPELREWMNGEGYSVRRLGKDLGVSFVTIQRWVDGTNRVPPYLPLALAGLQLKRALSKS